MDRGETEGESQLTERRYTVQVSARVCQIGNPRSRNVWYAFHGLGQRADSLARRFLRMSDLGRACVILPEAPHRYLKSPSEKTIGACWFTGEDRATAVPSINDYLDGVSADLEPPEAQVTLFGFSQGGLVACRWLVHRRVPVAHLVLWSSVVPRDVRGPALAASLRNMRVTIVLGTRDPFATAQLRADSLGALNDAGAQVEFIEFPGDHEIDENALQRLWSAPAQADGEARADL